MMEISGIQGLPAMSSTPVNERAKVLQLTPDFIRKAEAVIEGQVIKNSYNGVTIKTSIGEIVLPISSNSFKVGDAVRITADTATSRLEISTMQLSKAGITYLPQANAAQASNLRFPLRLPFQLTEAIAVQEEIVNNFSSTYSKSDLHPIPRSQSLDTVYISESDPTKLTTMNVLTINKNGLEQLVKNAQNMKSLIILDLQKILGASNSEDNEVVKSDISFITRVQPKSFWKNSTVAQPFMFDDSGRVYLLGKVITDSKYNTTVIRTAIGDLVSTEYEAVPKSGLIIFELLHVNSIISPSKMVQTFLTMKQAVDALNTITSNLITEAAVKLLPHSALLPHLQAGDYKSLSSFLKNIFIYLLNTEQITSGKTNSTGTVINNNATASQGEHNVLQDLVRSAQSTNWQVLAVPVLNVSNLQSVVIYLKRYTDEESKNYHNTKRFMVELRLNKFGELWLDGLVSTREDKLYVAVVVRSEVAIAEDVLSGLYEVFAYFKQVLGFQGNITFQLIDGVFKRPYEQDSSMQYTQNVSEDI